MKNRGFTLIELLAVITILSIILLIAVFSVSSVISNSKSNLHDTQIKQILRAAEYYNNKEGTYDSVQNVSVKYLSENGYLKDDEVKDPKTGKNMNGSVVIKYNGKKFSYKYKEDGTICNTNNDEASTDPGTKYECEVNDGTKYNFYVLSKTDDGKINLIMDNNICENGQAATDSECNCKWDNVDNQYGPEEAIEKVYNATKDWVNIPDMIFEYNDSGYSTDETNGYSSGYRSLKINDNGITIIAHDNPATNRENYDKTQIISYENNKKMKTRLPSLEEIEAQKSSDSLPDWLFDHLEGNENGIERMYGYWLLTSYYDKAPSHAKFVEFSKSISASSVNDEDFTGIRPVITVSNGFLSAINSD